MTAAYNEFHGGVMTTFHLVLRAEAEHRLDGTFAKPELEAFWKELQRFVALLTKLKGTGRIMRLWDTAEYKSKLSRTQRNMEGITTNLAIALNIDIRSIVSRTESEVREILEQLRRPIVVIDEQIYAAALKSATISVATALRHDPDRSLALQDVFVAQDVRRTDRFSFSTDVSRSAEVSTSEQAEEPEQLQLERQSVKVLLADPGERFVVLFGHPGSGKSTALRVQALEWAAADPAERQHIPFPVLVGLKRYASSRASGKRLLDCMAEGGAANAPLNKGALVRMLESKREVLLMLDGLDEVFNADLLADARADVIADIQVFNNQFCSSEARGYRSNRVVVTSRIIGYQHSDCLDGGSFNHYTLQSLNKEQIEEFVRLWHQKNYTDNETAMRDERQQRLLKAMKQSSPLRQLARNPLLLTIIAIVNHKSKLLTRPALYQECCNEMLDRWKTAGGQSGRRGHSRC